MAPTTTRFALVFGMALAMAVTPSDQTVGGCARSSEQVECANSGAENDLPASTLEFVLKIQQADRGGTDGANLGFMRKAHVRHGAA
jgi:hypothetical protein